MCEHQEAALGCRTLRLHWAAIITGTLDFIRVDTCAAINGG
jgi:hypothetical protein